MIILLIHSVNETLKQWTKRIFPILLKGKQKGKVDIVKVELHVAKTAFSILNMNNKYMYEGCSANVDRVHLCFLIDPIPPAPPLHTAHFFAKV